MAASVGFSRPTARSMTRCGMVVLLALAGASTLQAAAQLEFVGLTSSASAVSPGQTGISVLATVRNTGDGTANVTGAYLTLVDSAGQSAALDYTVTASPGNPLTLPAAQTRTFTFDVAVSDAPMHNAVSVRATVRATDASSGSELSVAGSRRVLLVGGEDASSGVLTDCWEWDGTSWRQLSFAGSSPSAGHGVGLAFDSDRNKLVLFGGLDESGTHKDETWELQGTVWSQKVASPSPSGREFHGMAYDATRKKTVLFGGTDANGDRLDDTWEWDGTSWTAPTVSTRPSNRFRVSLAHDVSRGKTVLFGGALPNSQFAGDTWEWSGTAWTQLFPGSPPSARWPYLAYDASRTRSVLFGGLDLNSNLLNDVHEWNGSAWSAKSATPSPAVRSGHGIAYDVARQRVVIFGGTGGSDLLQDTWEWDGSSWTDKSPTLSPPKRRYGAMSPFDVPPSVEWTVQAPAQLSISSITTTASTVVQGQRSVAVTMVATNSGDASATITAASLRFQGTADRTSEYLVTADAGNPTSMAGKQPATFRFAIDVGSSATAEAIVLRGALAGTDGNSGSPISTSTTSSAGWTVVRAAVLRIDTISSALSQVSQAQGGLTVQMSVTNTGQSMADLTAAALTFTGTADRTNQYSVVPSSANAITVAAGATVNLVFDVTVGATATAEAIVLDGTVSGKDATTGAVTSDSGATTTHGWTVRASAALRIDSIATTPVLVSRGQSGIAVRMTVTNPGGASAQVSSATLRFTGAADRTSEYTPMHSGTHPSTLAAGDSANFDFTVTVGASATAESITIDGSVTGTDANSAGALSDTSATTTDGWTVQVPASLRLDSIATTPTLVSRGQTGLVVQMSVTNPGGAAANLTGASLVLTGSADRTSQYTITADGTNASSLAGGATATLKFTVTVGASATAESITIDGSVTGTDANSAGALSDTSATTTDGWTVQVPASLRLDSIATTPTLVSRGQTGLVVQMSVTNPGGA
ncbi:MAG: hypothetical protein HY816_21855, partial [Candidatus Wallbacteria bacterium]|nr:hypothetical protein [Candidatus Wallbacteria bacterium]